MQIDHEGKTNGSQAHKRVRLQPWSPNTSQISKPFYESNVDFRQSVQIFKEARVLNLNLLRVWQLKARCWIVDYKHARDHDYNPETLTLLKQLNLFMKPLLTFDKVSNFSIKPLSKVLNLNLLRAWQLQTRCLIVDYKHTRELDYNLETLTFLKQLNLFMNPMLTFDKVCKYSKQPKSSNSI